MIAETKGTCQKCGAAFIMPTLDLGRHVDESTGDLMCWKCCKERYWHTPERCEGCSEKTMCKGLFLHNFKNHILKGRVEGV